MHRHRYLPLFWFVSFSPFPSFKHTHTLYSKSVLFFPFCSLSLPTKFHQRKRIVILERWFVSGSLYEMLLWFVVGDICVFWIAMKSFQQNNEASSISTRMHRSNRYFQNYCDFARSWNGIRQLVTSTCNIEWIFSTLFLPTLVFLPEPCFIAHWILNHFYNSRQIFRFFAQTNLFFQ